jgi:hypothetical protein
MTSYTDEQVLSLFQDDVKEMVESLLADRTRLQAQVEALRADAERYRWIRNDQTGAVEEAILIDRYGDVEVRLGVNLDEAIDSARAKKGDV